jgi:diaminohydroxyphosphoribosylaminopyrimidine deaminase/5-amino-6-(5-phosphoribosylamino)uracil reductase
LYDGPGSVPRRVVVDPRLRSEAAWLWPGEARPLLFCARAALETRGRELERHADLVPLPAANGGLDVHALVAALEEREMWSVLVEGGGETHRAFFEARLWDRVYLYRNPRLRLEGLEWSAAAAFRREIAGLAPHEALDLGGDGLEVYVHPALG